MLRPLFALLLAAPAAAQSARPPAPKDFTVGIGIAPVYAPV